MQSKKWLGNGAFQSENSNEHNAKMITRIITKRTAEGNQLRPDAFAQFEIVRSLLEVENI